MPKEHETNDIPEPRNYEVVPEGFYRGHVWEKGDAIMRDKKPPKVGQFPMWRLAFRLTHTLKGEVLNKPVIVYTDFFEIQMITIQTSVGGHPLQGKPVIVGVVVEEYDKSGDLEFDGDGNVKMDFETGKPKRKMMRAQNSKVDRGEKGQGKAEVDLDPKGKALEFEEMKVIDLEEGRTPDAPSAQEEKEDLPF